MQLPTLLRRRPPAEHLVEAERRAAAALPAPPPRRGFMPGVPRGGATKDNPATGPEPTANYRAQYLRALCKLYERCVWAGAAVDAIAKTVTAGGVELVPDIEPHESGKLPPPTPLVKAAQALFDWVNPEEDIVQLTRRILTDLLIYGDAFVEVSWRDGFPVALWSLDVPSTSVQTDEHGVVTGYHQELDGGLVADFKPREVIHFKLDSPQGGVYGLGPTQKAELVINEWLFASALVQEVFKQGDPPKVWIDWPLALQESEIERYSDQHRSRNRGLKNIGNPIETKGGGQVKELQQNRIVEYLSALDQKRDEIIAAYHVPPAEVGVIESGNLGGGTGSSQFKMFLTIACQPPAAIVLEKLTSKVLIEGFGIKGWTVRFGEFDWRDDNVVDMIRDRRIRNGTWTLNRSRRDVGEPPVKGGDEPILVDRQNMVTWTDIAALSKANVANAQAQAVIAKAMNKGAGGSDDDGADQGTNATTSKESAPPMPAHLRESWQRRYELHRRAVLREMRERTQEGADE